MEKPLLVGAVLLAQLLVRRWLRYHSVTPDGSFRSLIAT